MPIITNSAPLFVKINAPEARGKGGEDFVARVGHLGWVVDWVTCLKEYVPIDTLGIELGAGFC
jgi:hypothetical protein